MSCVASTGKFTGGKVLVGTEHPFQVTGVTNHSGFGGQMKTVSIQEIHWLIAFHYQNPL